MPHTATIVDFDLILVLEDGCVLEYGSPQDLLADPKSRFSRLAESQFGKCAPSDSDHSFMNPCSNSIERMNNGNARTYGPEFQA